jgi:hypothetical protein
MGTSAPPSNRYRRFSEKSIVYNVLKSDGGWRVEASIPRGTSSDDRVKVVRWFENYRMQIRKQHPLWITRFYPGDSVYHMEVRPVANPRELLEKGQDLKSIWTEEIVNRG